TAQGVKPPPKELASVHSQSIRIIAEQMAVSLEAARGMVGRQVEDLFRRGALGAIQAETARGGTALDAAKRMIATWERQGVTSFIDADGKRWGLSTYAEMVSRTTTREATDQALYNRLEERGHDLIEVTRHSGECPKCLNAINTYGTIYSLSGTSEKYPAYDDGKAAGLWHPNCVHRPTPYIERYAA
ncbi:MAG: phage minor capsid protein, partial [Armatimonadota bacterium]